VLAFASAAVTAFWLLGGIPGLDTVGDEIEQQARERSASVLAVLVVTLVAKLVRANARDDDEADIEHVAALRQLVRCGTVAEGDRSIS
jgi:hypothetical protein